MYIMNTFCNHANECILEDKDVKENTEWKNVYVNEANLKDHYFF